MAFAVLSHSKIVFQASVPNPHLSPAAAPSPAPSSTQLPPRPPPQPIHFPPAEDKGPWQPLSWVAAKFLNCLHQPAASILHFLHSSKGISQEHFLKSQASAQSLLSGAAHRPPEKVAAVSLLFVWHCDPDLCTHTAPWRQLWTPCSPYEPISCMFGLHLCYIVIPTLILFT